MKDVINAIRQLIITLSTKKGAGLWFLFILLSLSIGGYFYFKNSSHAKTNPCEYLEKQNRDLISVLLDVRRGIDSAAKLPQQTSFFQTRELLPMYAAYLDTVPKRMSSYDSLINKLLKKIDSAVIKNSKQLKKQ